MTNKIQTDLSLTSSLIILLSLIGIIYFLEAPTLKAETLGTNPTITLKGENPTLLDLTNISSQTTPNLGAVAIDGNGVIITAGMKIKSAYSGNDSYVLTYEVVSASGVSSVPVTRTVKIKFSIADGLFLRDYLGAELKNNPIEVAKLQIFLRDHEGMSEVQVNSIFDKATELAIKKFQDKYKEEVLTPWGIESPTGYVFVTTRHQVNDIFFDRVTPLSLQEKLAMGDTAETSLMAREPSAVDNDDRTVGILNGGDSSLTENIIDNTEATSTKNTVGSSLIENGKDTLASVFNKDGIFGGISASAFSLPQNINELYKILLDLILIVIVIGIVWLLVRKAIYGDVSPPAKSLDQTRGTYFVVAFIVASVASVIFGMSQIVVPLAIITILVLIYLLTQVFIKKETAVKKKH